MASSSSGGLLRPQVFDGKNYVGWSRLMKIYLSAEGTFTIVEGKEKQPVVTKAGDVQEEAALTAWQVRDMRALATICMALSKEIAKVADIDNGSAALWNWLADKYGKKLEADVMHIYSAVMNLKFDGTDLAGDITKMQSLYFALAQVDPKYTVHEAQQKLQLYKSLPKDWQGYVDYLTSQPALTWEQAMSLLLQREIRVKDQESEGVPLEQAVFVSSKDKKTKSAAGKKSANQQHATKPWKDQRLKKNQCKVCKGFGHWGKECPQRKKAVEANVVVHIGDLREELYLAEDAFHSTESTLESKLVFTVDSACTSTMVKTADLLKTSKTSQGKVQLGSTTKVPITAVGNFELKLSDGGVVSLPNSLVIPSMRKNLLSVPKLDDASVITIFDRNRVLFYRSGARVAGV
ncbi:hypothetical protein R1flu_020480 [Riccia fluitans]|uniref:Retrovirus-related Pol polyprotein from transposon TNT 1-94-like beta-barrel domain-containing protein n=1 Tax=Riccia fluitans TaxID=41844 RepID=A0ABD1ZLM5_9MARC